MTPPAIQAATSTVSLPAKLATGDGARKIPTPMTVPTMSATASKNLRVGRGAACADETGAVVGAGRRATGPNGTPRRKSPLREARAAEGLKSGGPARGSALPSASLGARSQAGPQRLHEIDHFRGPSRLGERHRL